MSSAMLNSRRRRDLWPAMPRRDVLSRPERRAVLPLLGTCGFADRRSRRREGASNRNLLDFIMETLDNHGCSHIAYADDNTVNLLRAANQTSGPCL